MLINYLLALGAHVFLLKAGINGSKGRTTEQVIKNKDNIEYLESVNPKLVGYAGNIGFTITTALELTAWWNANQVFLANGAEKSALIGYILLALMLVSIALNKIKYRGAEGVKRMLLTETPKEHHKEIFPIIIRGSIILMLLLV